MPKSVKKKREKAADFTKSKLKLGKKRAPTNVVDTSFKARSIALPGQSITVDKGEDIPTTKRKLSVEDLLVHLRHYNSTTRKDAILGLRELLESHWSVLQMHLVALLGGLMRLINDEDTSVRKTLTSFLAWYLPRILPEELTPHSHILLLYTASAQTHIFPEIRIDAIRIINILLECIPESVTAGWCQGNGSRLLDGYLGLLNAGTTYNEPEGSIQATSTASVVLSPASRLVVLESLSKFLRTGMTTLRPGGIDFHDTSETSPFWFLSDAFKNIEAFEAFDSLLRCTAKSVDIRLWSAEPDPTEDFVFPPSVSNFSEAQNWALEDLSNACGSLDQASSVKMTAELDYDHLARLARNLQSTLVSIFLDSAPTAFSPSGSPSETSVHLVLAVSQIAQTLHGTLLQRRSFQASARQSGALEDLGSLLGYMAPYFPFKSNNKIDVKVEQVFQELNVIFCQLAALHQFAMDKGTHDYAKFKQKAKLNAGSNPWITGVSAHIIRLLKGESLSTNQVARPLTSAAYLSLAPAIWFLLDSETPSHAEQRHGVLSAVLYHSIKTLSKSATKQASVEFISRLALLDSEPKYVGHFRTGRNADVDKKFTEWLLHLPQCIWEIGATNVRMTEVILKTMLRLLQRKPRVIDNEVGKILASKLVPYFSINHTVRGQLPGPYTKLPSSSGLRKLALDVVATLLMVLPRDLAGNVSQLPVAVDLGVAGTHERSYWMHMGIC